MNIEEAILRVSEAAENSILVARPPLTWGAEAMFVQATREFAVPPAAVDAGYEYVLEIEDIRELLVFLKKKRVSSRTAAEFVIHYAIYDTTPAWIADVPDA